MSTQHTSVCNEGEKEPLHSLLTSIHLRYTVKSQLSHLRIHRWQDCVSDESYKKLYMLTMGVSLPQCRNRIQKTLPYVPENSQRSKFSPAKLQDCPEFCYWISYHYFILLLLNIMHLQAIHYPQMRPAKIPWGSQVVRKLRLPKAIIRCAALDASEWGEEVIAPSCSSPGGTSPLSITTTHSFSNSRCQNDRLKRLCCLKCLREWGLSGEARLGSSYLASSLSQAGRRLGQAAGSRNPLRGSAAPSGACLTATLAHQWHRVQHNSLFI